MNGMEMLLKQIGFDPKKMNEDIEKFVTGVQLHLKQQNDKLERIEETLRRIESKQGEIMIQQLKEASDGNWKPS